MIIPEHLNRHSLGLYYSHSKSVIEITRRENVTQREKLKIVERERDVENVVTIDSAKTRMLSELVYSFCEIAPVSQLALLPY